MTATIVPAAAGEAVPLSQHDLLGAAESASVAGRVRALEPHWTRRSTGGFFSLGAASYIDATAGLDRYLAAAEATNPLLLDAFGDLYDVVLRFFRKLLDEDVRLDAQRAVPGFHVFVLRGEDRSGDNPAKRAHCDLQWQLAYPGSPPEATLSFTLAVEVPSGGAGMAIWPVRYRDLSAVEGGARAIAHAQAPRIVTYVPGRLVVHDGMVLHAIGPSGAARATGLRATLQGHGVRFDKRWLLYW